MLKRKRLIFWFAVLVLIALPPLNFVRSKYVLPILMYHSVIPDAPPADRLTVSVKAFERQMRFLKEHRYNVLPLEEAARLIRERKNIPPHSVAITFDDGNKDNYLHAFPVLKKYGIRAAVFVIVKEVGRPDKLSWDEIKQMQDSGLISFGSHALGPEPLVNIKSEDELKSQIFDSRRALEGELGRPVNMFSYPEGRFNKKIRSLVIAAGYRLAVATNPGKMCPSDDVFALKRLRISSTSDNLFVFWVESSGYYNFLRERRHK
jgi:peptidoglycan/xylan/chitin deacetylase (PgdA/CDA1 family)